MTGSSTVFDVGERTSAREQAETVVRWALEGGAGPIELAGRCRVAELDLLDARLESAQGHLDTCNARMTGGENWRNVPARVAHLEAVMLAQRGRDAEAAEVAARVLVTYQRAGLVWWQVQLELLRFQLGDIGALDRVNATLARVRPPRPWLEALLEGACLPAPARPDRAHDLIVGGGGIETVSVGRRET